MDGWSWWQRLRGVPECARIPIVFMLPVMAPPAEIPGAIDRDQRLAKPFRVEDLERMVVGALGSEGASLEVPSPAPSPMPPSPSRPNRAVDPTKPSAGYRPLSALRGELDKIGLSSVLTLLEMERQSGILLIERGPRTSRVYFRKGRVIRAEADDPRLSGAAAVYEVLGWNAGTFDLLIGEVGGIDEIQTSTTFLLMEGARRTDEANEKRRQEARATATPSPARPPPPPPALPPPLPGKGKDKP